MIQDDKGNVTITNDGATILQQMKVMHPAARMLVELSKAQDIEAGDGTTSVVVIAGALLNAASKLLGRGLHPTTISDSFQECATKSVDILTEMARPIKLSDRETLLKSANTSLNSKVVSQYSGTPGPMAVDAVLKVVDEKNPGLVDLRDIKVIPKIGGTVEDTELVNGLVLTQKTLSGSGSGIRRVEKAKIGLIQFCLSAPKTDMDNQVPITDYTQTDKIMKEERTYILNIVRQIKKSGCNVLLIQKSILRDAISDLALHFLNKMKILVVKDIERSDIDFVCKSTGCKPIASVDHFNPEMLATAELVEEVNVGAGRAAGSNTVSIVVRGSNKLVLHEADRSIHDALCTTSCLVKNRAIIAGGSAPKTELAVRLNKHARTLSGMDAYCFQAYAEASEVIPYTLSENAGLSPIVSVTELRNRHANGDQSAGINVRRGGISDMYQEDVVQPLLVSVSEIKLATETVRSILKIDDIVNAFGSG